MEERINEILSGMERKHGIRIILAVESGSREWGFSSEDSDYDVRCVHACPEERYISLKEAEEQVNEIYEDGKIDVVSWDVRKFFSLFMKSNPTVSEWLSSRKVYLDNGFGNYSREDIRKIFEKGFDRERLKKHYLSLAKQNYAKYIQSPGEVLLKKYVYILRGLGCMEFISKTGKLPPLDWKESSVYIPEYIKKKFSDFVRIKKESESTKAKKRQEN